MPSIKLTAKGANVEIEGKEFTGRECGPVIDKLVERLGRDPAAVDPEWKPDALIEENQETVSE